MPQINNSESKEIVKKQINSEFIKIFSKITLKDLLNKEFIEKITRNKSALINNSSIFAYKIFSKYGFIKPKDFSSDISIKFWYLVYFSDFKIYKNFQKRYLYDLRKNLKDNSIMRPYYAFLVDKINLEELKTQEYGVFSYDKITEKIMNKQKAMGVNNILDSNNLKPVYLILGIPASGKDTQAEILAKTLNFPRLDAGSTFTSIIRNKEKYHEDISEAFAANQPIPSDVFMNIMSDKFKNKDFENGFILTQHSKSVDEAKQMIKCLESLNFQIKKVFFLSTNRNLAIERSIKRLNGVFTEKEPSIEVVIKRIDNYSKIIETIVDFYREKELLIELNGEDSIQVIANKILTYIEK